MAFVKVEDGYPECKGDFVRVMIKLETGGITRGMFYWNGGKPVFAFNGTAITDKVVAWDYFEISAWRRLKGIQA